MNADLRLERAKARFSRMVAICGGTADECWPWTGKTDISGYGQMWFEGRTIGAHRVSWTLNVGPIPEGMCVLHRCDNPPCIRPSHLFLGTKADNSNDRHAKGRTATGDRTPAETRARGEHNGNSKLTAETVAFIRRDFASGSLTRTAIAHRYGLNRSTVGRIVSGQAWRAA